MLRSTSLALSALLLVACGSADPDEDGLDNSTEKDLGTDPKLADSDGDGLTDLYERDNALDPLVADGDADGMSDGDEVKFGFDPKDPKSDGYKGGWPMQEVSVKDGIESEGKRPGTEIAVGKRFKRLHLKDQHGDEVDLYDFAGQGKKVVIDTAAQWCEPCQLTSQMVGGVLTADDLTSGGLQPEEVTAITAVADMVANGEIYWVSVLSEDFSGDGAVVKTAKEWDADFGSDPIAVLADTGKTMEDYMIAVGGGWPTMVLLNQNMTIVDIQSGWPGIVAFQAQLDQAE